MSSVQMHKEKRSMHEVGSAIARIRTIVLALACALIGGLGLFAMTAWLLIKGGPNVGEPLQLLGQYFIGYSVTWRGSLVGFLYGALLYGVIGWAVGKIYNGIVGIRFRTARDD